MKSDPSPLESDSWRWLYELEKPSPAFWSFLSQLGETSFEFSGQAAAYQGALNLSQSFLDETNHFITSQPSISLKTSFIERAFLVETDCKRISSLELDFFDRLVSLKLGFLKKTELLSYERIRVFP